MDFSKRGPEPQKHALGITMVIAFHAIVIYALVTGLGKKIVDVIKQPIETKVIEEVKLPPPPPERLLPPPPKLEAPPPPFIPPPEVNIQVPVTQTAPTITTVTTTKPPPGPPPKAAPVEAPKPAVRKNFAPAYKVAVPYPRQAIKDGIQGKVIAHLYVKADGSVSEVRIVSANPPRVFDRDVIRALSQYRFAPEPTGFIAEIEIDFKLTD